jgi:hypothetical protein
MLAHVAYLVTWRGFPVNVFPDLLNAREAARQLPGCLVLAVLDRPSVRIVA